MVEIDVLQVVGKLDVSEESSTIIETMIVNGFQIPPSHAESVSRMFERHWELATEFRPKNPNLRTGLHKLSTHSDCDYMPVTAGGLPG